MNKNTMNNKESGLAHFIKYNNAVPIVLGFLFLGTTASFAASPAVREAVYASDTAIASIDTSYLLSANIEKFPFAFRVTGVSEDDGYYFVSYDLNTLGVIDGVWRAVVMGKELRVSKAQLGEGDLEEFIESELAQVRASELRRLGETQDYEKRKGVSEKVLATAYRGLVGDLLKPKEERVPQYASELLKNDPLYVRNPVPLLTWDANAKIITPRQEELEEEDDEEEEDIRPYLGEEEPEEDLCAEVEGIQTDTTLCEMPPTDETPDEETLDGNEDGGGEESPAEEPPAEEPPSEEPPVEESQSEEPAITEDASEESGGEEEVPESGPAE